MFVHNNTVTATPCEPGVSRKVMAYNDQVMMCEITFEKGAKGNFHTHPHVQTTYIVKGSFAFTIDGETQVVNAGDSILMQAHLRLQKEHMERSGQIERKVFTQK